MGEDGNVSVLSCFRSPALIALLAVAAFAEAGKVTLKDGVISYPDGTTGRSVVQAGGPCSDLWVSPDGEMIAFIRMDKSRPDPAAISPFIERSTIFVASRSTGFKPVRVALYPPRVDGREWNVFRDPVLSPDRRTVYFLVPAAGTSYFLMRVPVAGGTARPITWVEAYCVVWGGSRSGDLAASVRAEPTDETQGVAHHYYHYDASGAAKLIGTREHDGDWVDFVRAWAHKYGGTCEANVN